MLSLCAERGKNMLYSKMVHTVQVRSMDIRRVTVWPSLTLTACTQNAICEEKGKTYATFKKDENHGYQECYALIDLYCLTLLQVCF
jgi:hypothetical protein